MTTLSATSLRRLVRALAFASLLTAIDLLTSRKVSAEDGGMQGRDMRMVDPMRLRCQECARSSDDAARGWRMYVGPDPDEPDAPLMLATYCRECAEREFGLSKAGVSTNDAWL